MPEPAPRTGLLAELLHAEARFFHRILGVLRFEAEIYDEIADDAAAIPQAFAVVIAASVLVGIGQATLAGVFFGIATAIFFWLVGAGLIWGVATLAQPRDVPFPRLLRCLGFGYVWFALLIGAALPFVGAVFGWIGLGGTFASIILGTRQVLSSSSARAAVICGIALGAPIIIVWILA